MNTYYIYRVTNKANSLSYIGMTSNFSRRIGQHLSHKETEPSVFHKALVEYGITSFTWEVIATTQSYDEAKKLEKLNIENLDTIFPLGYNEAYGSGGSPQTKPLVSLTPDGVLVKRYNYLGSVADDGYNVAAVTRTLKEHRYLSKGHNFMWEEDYLKDGPIVFQRRKTAKNAVPVVQCTLEGEMVREFESVADASEMTGIERSNIMANLSLRAKSAGGYIFVKKNDYPIRDIKKYKRNTKGVKVVQIDPLPGAEIKVFNSFTEAGDSLGVRYANIQKVADKPNRTAYGFKWKRLQ